MIIKSACNIEAFLENEYLPIQINELEKVDSIIKEKGLCIIAGYHASGKSSFGRRYSLNKSYFRRFYCKGLESKEIISEINNSNEPLFLDSITDHMYDDLVLNSINEKIPYNPLMLGVHIEPNNIDILFNNYDDKLFLVRALEDRDARFLIHEIMGKKIDNIRLIMEYSGNRRRDLVNLTYESYLEDKNLGIKSIENAANIISKRSRSVQEHNFNMHFTQVQKEIIGDILKGKTINREDIHSDILLKTGIIKKEDVFIINGKILEDTFRDIIK